MERLFASIAAEQLACATAGSAKIIVVGPKLLRRSQWRRKLKSTMEHEDVEEENDASEKEGPNFRKA